MTAWFKPRHVMAVRAIDGEVIYSRRFWRGKTARQESILWRSPLYDVLVDGVVVHTHVAPARLIERLRER